MSTFEYTVTELPPVWPGKRTQYPKRAPFKTNFTKTTNALASELRHLGAKKIEIALDIRYGDLRQDGRLRADARPKSPATILSFLDRDGQRNAYPCDRFAWWEDNLYAIAVVLEDLRRAERYGVQSTLLRAGFKALPSTTKIPTMTANQAATLIAAHGEFGVPGILAIIDTARSAIRVALSKTHPDKNNGDRMLYDQVDAARSVLSSHHGVSL